MYSAMLLMVMTPPLGSHLIAVVGSSSVTAVALVCIELQSALFQKSVSAPQSVNGSMLLSRVTGDRQFNDPCTKAHLTLRPPCHPPHFQNHHILGMSTTLDAGQTYVDIVLPTFHLEPAEIDRCGTSIDRSTD